MGPGLAALLVSGVGFEGWLRRISNFATIRSLNNELHDD